MNLLSEGVNQSLGNIERVCVFFVEKHIELK